MKICLVHAGDLSRPSGGTDRLVAFVRRWLDEGVNVKALIAKPDGTLPEPFDEVDVRPISVGKHGTYDQPVRGVLLARRARRVARREDAVIQVVHATLGGMVAATGVSGFVLDMHDLSYTSPYYTSLPLGSVAKRVVYAIERRAVRDASEIVVVSEPMKNHLVETWDVPAEKVLTVPNGYSESAVEGYQDIDPVAGRVVFLGTLHPKLDIEAIAEVARLPETDELVMVGDGAMANELEALKRDRDLDALRLEGRLPDYRAFELVASAEVAINPQNNSKLQVASSPVKLNYYAALGAPMVVSAGPQYVRDLGEHGAACVVPTNGDFASEVQRLLQEPERRERMAARAEEMAARTTWAEQSRQLMDVYSRLNT